MERQYSFLKVAASILKIISYLVGLIGLISALIILFGKTPSAGKLASLGVLFIGGLYFLILFIVAEVINLFIKIDERLQNIENNIQNQRREIR